jgi:hypothetical protein
MTETATASASILSKVQGLIARAEHPGTPPEEAASCMEKAQALMLKYRIAQEEAIAADPTSAEPVVRTFVSCDDTPMQRYYTTMVYSAAAHAGVRVHQRWVRNGTDGWQVHATAVGYDGDVSLFEWVYTAARFAFADNLEPRNDPERTEVDNVYRMRRAGITRRQTAIRMGWGDTHAAHAKVARLYKAESERRGEKAALDGRGISAAKYRTSYAEEFVWEFARRLRQARDAADAVGGALVLHGRQERVDEAFYAQFPELRPGTDVALPETPKPETEAQRARRLRRQARELGEHYRHESNPAVRAGRRAGAAAAAEVQLDRAGSANRVDASRGVQIATALGYRVAE